ncbi:MAG: DUF4266 domain-containing protein [Campylobacterota bacterium]|nr:DUF4266 domain-containing protein [Campylobacterota bacterium]
MIRGVLLISIIFFSGCVKEVQPWEKEQLASELMTKDGGNALHKQFQEHVYFSKEGTKGGVGVAGGGCGCN